MQAHIWDELICSQTVNDVLCYVIHSCPTLRDPHGLQPTRLLCPWESPGKSTGGGCHTLLQGIFLTQGTCISSVSCILWQVLYQ